MTGVRPGVLTAISDLHMSSGALDDCDAELERLFCEFVTRHCTAPEGVELVINGDFLDFVQAEPWEGDDLRSMTAEGIRLSFTEEQSLSKLAAIHRAHGPVFAALSTFLADPKNLLVIIPGNHDADFFWPRVQQEFARLVGGSGGQSSRLVFWLDQVYRPSGFPGLWIEHGHQYDVLNSFFVGDEPRWSPGNPPILPDTSGTERLLECVGTGFLVQFLNKVDEGYPFVDNVKPFGRFLQIFGRSALQPGYAPIAVSLTIWRLMKFVARMTMKQPGDLLGISAGEGSGVGALLQQWLTPLSVEQKQRLMSDLRSCGFSSDRSLALLLQDESAARQLMDCLAENPHVLPATVTQASSDLSLGGTSDDLALGKGFFADETQNLVDAASVAIKQGAVCVVMGHTHEQIEKGFSYVNTGCWTRYYQFAREEKLRNWAHLKGGSSYQEFPFSLNYCEFRAGEALSAQLHTFVKKDR